MRLTAKTAPKGYAAPVSCRGQAKSACADSLSPWLGGCIEGEPGKFSTASAFYSDALYAQEVCAVPVSKGGGQALHFGPPVGFARAVSAVLHRHEQPEDEAQLVVGQEVFPGVIGHATRLQRGVIAAQDGFLAPIFVALLRGPEGGAEVGEIIAADVETGGLPVQQVGGTGGRRGRDASS